MSAVLMDLPTFPLRRSLTGCADCGAEVPLSPRTGRCTDCNERECYEMALRLGIRRHTPRPSLLTVILPGVAWLGGAALLCVPLFAIVPSVVAAVK
jgi:hypothetical protein